jgi:hypothetical protein
MRQWTSAMTHAAQKMVNQSLVPTRARIPITYDLPQSYLCSKGALAVICSALRTKNSMEELKWRRGMGFKGYVLKPASGGHFRARQRTRARNARRRMRSLSDRPLKRRSLAALRARHLRAEKPQIARPRHRMLGSLRRIVGIRQPLRAVRALCAHASMGKLVFSHRVGASGSGM